MTASSTACRRREVTGYPILSIGSVRARGRDRSRVVRRRKAVLGLVREWGKTVPNSDVNRVMSTLNLVVKLKPGAKAGVERIDEAMEATLRQGADAIGTLHEARFVRYDDETILVITTYDGSFEDYIYDFTKHMAGIFNFLLSDAADPPPLPVEKNPQAFADWVEARNLPTLAYYNVTPTLSVQDIRALESKVGA